MVSLAKLGRVMGYAETYCVDATSSPGLGTFFDVPFNEGTAELTVTRAELDPSYALQDNRAGRLRVLGMRNGTFKMTINLAPTGYAGSGDTSAHTSALTTLLSKALGGISTGTGTTFSAGWTSNTGTVASAAGLHDGDVIGWVNSSGVMEVARIENIVSNTLTLDHAFSATPAASDVCYAGITIYPTKAGGGTMQFLVEGAETTDRWLLLGCQVTAVEFVSDPTGKGIPKVNLTYAFPLFLKSSETAGSVTAALANATYTNYQPIVEFQGIYRMMAVGTPAYSSTETVPISAQSWKPKITYISPTSPSALPATLGGAPMLQPIAGHDGGAPVEGSFTTYWQGLSWWTARDARTTYCQRYQIGIHAGSTMVMSATCAQVLNPQRASSDAEIEGETVNYLGLLDADAVGTTELATTPYLVAFL